MNIPKAVLTGMLWVRQDDLPKEQLDYIKKQYTHINLSNPDVPFYTYLELKGKIGIPYGDTSKVNKVLPNVEIEDKRIAPIFDSPKSSNMPLRDYQEKAMYDILHYYSTGGTCFNLAGKCGSGKTYMLANLLARLNTKVLIIANQRMLINQISTEITNVLGEAPNILSSKNTEVKDINVATSQFISQNANVWYDIKKHIGLLVLDEAEALASNSVMRIFQRSPAKYRIFISATFSRSVDKRTGALIDFAGDTRIELDNNALIKPTVINVLCEEQFYPPMNKNMYTKAKIKFYDKPSINTKVLDVIKYSVSKNRQVLVACDIISKQNEIMDLCNNVGIPAKCLNGKTSDTDRKSILDDYDKGKIKVILGLNVLNAGLSVPKISTIIRLSTSSSPEKLEQLIGRGQRDFLGKDGCYVIDFWFKGFKNNVRLQMYSLKERVDGWKVHTVPWNLFKAKYLNSN